MNIENRHFSSESIARIFQVPINMLGIDREYEITAVPRRPKAQDDGMTISVKVRGRNGLHAMRRFLQYAPGFAVTDIQRVKRPTVYGESGKRPGHITWLMHPKTADRIKGGFMERALVDHYVRKSLLKATAKVFDDAVLKGQGKPARTESGKNRGRKKTNHARKPKTVETSNPKTHRPR